MSTTNYQVPNERASSYHRRGLQQIPSQSTTVYKMAFCSYGPARSGSILSFLIHEAPHDCRFSRAISYRNEDEEFMEKGKEEWRTRGHKLSIYTLARNG